MKDCNLDVHVVAASGKSLGHLRPCPSRLTATSLVIFAELEALVYGAATCRFAL